MISNNSSTSNNKSGRSFFKSDGFRNGGKSLLASIVCILIGLIVGLLVMMIVSFTNPTIQFSNSFSGFVYLIIGPLGGGNPLSDLGNTIFYSTPLILTGLSVAIAYKTGLFNIGAPGQYVMGTIGCLMVALSIDTGTRGFSSIMVWILAIIVGILFGMLWGAIPGLLKALFNINEVIVCIMTNWIAANMSSWIFSSMKFLHSTENTKGAYLKKVLTNYTPKLGLDQVFQGSYADMGIILAIIAAVIVLIILAKTTFGYELKACGFNKNASKYAGLNEKRNIVLSMVIAGGLAGLGACLYYLNPGIEYKYESAYASLPAYGFNGIASAFLANCNPVGIIFSSLFIRWISMGGESLTSVGFNRYIADVIIAVIIYLAGFTRIMKDLFSKIAGRFNAFREKRKLASAAVSSNALATTEVSVEDVAKTEEAKSIEDNNVEKMEALEERKEEKTSKVQTKKSGSKGTTSKPEAKTATKKSTDKKVAKSSTEKKAPAPKASAKPAAKKPAAKKKGGK